MSGSKSGKLYSAKICIKIIKDLNATSSGQTQRTKDKLSRNRRKGWRSVWKISDAEKRKYKIELCEKIIKLITFDKNNRREVWRDDSEVKSTGYSSGGHRFNSQYLHGIFQVLSAPENLMPSSFLRCQPCPGITDTHVNNTATRGKTKWKKIIRKKKIQERTKSVPWTK